MLVRLYLLKIWILLNWLRNICQISLKTRLKKNVPLMINLNSDTETEKNSEVNELQILYNAAMILHEKVQEIPKLNLPWPPLASDLTMDNVQKVVPCELYNMLAWTCGFSSEPTLSEYVPIKGKNSTKLTSIEIQDWYPWNRLVIDGMHNLNSAKHILRSYSIIR